jgi:anthranilate phosphoribosyltransferase
LGPESFGESPVSAEALYAGETIEECAALLRGLLEGRGAPAHQSVVVANAALAMWCKEDGRGELSEYAEKARESLRSKAALRALNASIEG